MLFSRVFNLINRSFIAFLLLTLISCKSREFIKYNELSFEERAIYDNSFKDLRSRSSESYSHIIAKKSIVAKRNADWVHDTAPKIPESFSLSESNNITHLSSGSEFQLNIGNFIRYENNTHQYDQTGNNVSVGYGFHGPFKLSLVHYLYQDSNSINGLEKQVEAINLATKNYYKDAKLVTQETFGKEGIRLLHSYKIGEQEVYSDNYLFLSQRWVTNVNVTYPVAKKSEAELEIAKYLRNMPQPK